MMKKETALFAVALLAGVVFHSNSATADDKPAVDRTPSELSAARSLLNEGKETGILPAGVVVRVFADLFGVDDKTLAEAKARGVVLEESLKETWEFTAKEVHRVVVEFDDKNRRTYRRVESRPFDSKLLCQELIDGKALEIGAEEKEGRTLQFAGTNFHFGGRAIEILRDGEKALDLHEYCTVAGYHESEARAFGTLYEKLASQARKLFKPKADESK
jgi:hypothetical protein